MPWNRKQETNEAVCPSGDAKLHIDGCLGPARPASRRASSQSQSFSTLEALIITYTIFF